MQKDVLHINIHILVALSFTTSQKKQFTSANLYIAILSFEEICHLIRRHYYCMGGFLQNQLVVLLLIPWSAVCVI